MDGDKDFVCVKCGKATAWNEELGVEPLCVVCFDRLVDFEGGKQSRAWLMEHHDRVVEYGKNYYKRHRFERLLKQRNHWWLHHSFHLEYGRAYYRRNRLKIIEQTRLSKIRAKECKLSMLCKV